MSRRANHSQSDRPIYIQGVIVESLDTSLLKWLDTTSAGGDVILRVKRVDALSSTPAETERPGNLYAVYVDDSGKVEWLTNSSYDPDLDAVLFETGHFSVYGVGYKKPAPAFTDITGLWAADNIIFAANRGIDLQIMVAVFSQIEITDIYGKTHVVFSVCKI